jgi:hypothetical protein
MHAISELIGTTDRGEIRNGCAAISWVDQAF